MSKFKTVDQAVDPDLPAAGRTVWYSKGGQAYVRNDTGTVIVLGNGAHASTHSDGGSDEISVEDLATADTNTSFVLRPDGVGGVAFSAEAGGGLITSVDTERFQTPGGDLRFSDNTESTLDFFVGTTLEIPYVTVTESGGIVSLNLEQFGGGDLTLVFSDGFYVLDCTPACTVALTAGTDAVPVLNYIYVDQGTKLLTATTASTWPAVEMVRVATVLVQSATGVATDGVYKSHSWTDHSSEHLQHLNEWVRSQPATWRSGVAPTLTITGGSPDTVIFTSALGVVLEMHPHDFPAFSGTPDMFVVNDPTVPYRKITDLNTVLTDALGGSLSARRFELVIWGTTGNGDSKLFVNLPIGSYGTNNAVLEDADRLAVHTIPTEFRGTGFLIAGLKLRHQTSGGGTWTEVELTDLRGLQPSTTPGGGASSSVEFLDSEFRVLNIADPTRALAIDASAITTSTTRTITVPDADITIDDDGASRPPNGAASGQLGGTYPSPDVRGIRESGGTELTMGAVADGETLQRSGTSVIGVTPAGGGNKLVLIDFERDATLSASIRVKSVGANASGFFYVHIPTDLDTLVEIYLVCTPSISMTSEDVSLYTEYGGQGEDVAATTEFDFTFTFTGDQTDWTQMDLSSVFSGVAAGDNVGLEVDHEAIGGTIYYFALVIEYTPT